MIDKSEWLKCILFTSFVFLISISATAQRGLNCSERLNQAEDWYEEGKLSYITNHINGGECFLKGGYTKEEKIRAYRLLTLVHIFNDDEPSAEESAINLLSADPEHPLNEEDPVELVLLFEKYRSNPIFRVGLKIGTNVTLVESIVSYNSFSNGFSKKKYSLKPGFVSEFTIEYNLVNHLDIMLGFQYVLTNYEVAYNSITDEPPTIGERNGFVFNLGLQETQSSLKAPLMIKYHYDFKKISPYFLLGASIDYLASAKFDGSRKGTIESPTGGNLNLNAFNMRNKWNYSYFGGIGVNIRVNKVHFFLIEARYALGGNNVVNRGNIYANPSLNFDQAHTDDYKKLNNISISIGYLHSIYNPKKYSDKKIAKILANKRKRKK